MKRFLDLSAECNFWIFLLFIFFIPFSIAACSILLGLLCVPFILYLLKRRPFPPLPGFFWCFLVFAATSVLSTFFAVDFKTALAGNKELLRFLVFPLALLILNSPRRVRQSLLIVFCSATLSALLGAGEAVWKGYSLARRLKGLTSHWMTFAGLLMLAFVFFSIYWLLASARGRRRWLAGAAPLLLMMVVIALSLTRQVWVGITAGVLLFLLYYRPKWIAVGIPLLAILLLLLPRTVQRRFFSIVDPHDPSNQDRIYMIVTGWHMLIDHPLTGVGTNNVGILYPRYRHPLATKDNPHLHNNFMQMLAERGLLGFLAFSAAWILFFFEISRRVKGKKGRFRDIGVAVMFTVVAFLVAGLFEYNFGDAEVRFLLLYFMALPFLALPEEEYDHIETSGRDLLPIL